MHFRFVFKVLGAMIVFLGLSMLAPLIVALIYGEGDWPAFGISAAATVGFGALTYLLFRKQYAEISNRDGFFIVTMAWLLAAAFGGLPYYFQHVFDAGGASPSFVHMYTDCFFEAASGLTTTGATVLTDIEGQTHGILFWRALTQWLGGMGIILLGVAILPLLGVGGMQLFKAEVPGPTADKLTPRVAETAKLLWGVYLLITVLEVVLLKIGGMSLFDAICHAFATLATGGFSTNNMSVEGYNSAYFDFVIGVFMILAGINFALHFQVLRGRWKAPWRDPEFRFYILLMAGMMALLTVALYVTRTYPTMFESFRRAFFQVPAIITTTGFTTADFDTWPDFLRILMLGLMFVGGMSGSTGGSVKIMRVQLLLKYAYHELYRLIHPRAVIPLRLGRMTVPDPVMRSISNFIILYLSLFLLCSLIMGALGLDFLTAISSVAATIGNVGPGLAGVGAHQNYAAIPLLGKWVLILCMIIGRLEIYTVLVLLVPRYWRR
ncbi:MAG: TrkH family potassium uptake protein [Candidatus Lernaella stagnicola]|nr:TrkH family potassium uptake protein [Candidatus Lernaella stagnicola]